MPEGPPVVIDRTQLDAEHLRLLVIFHYIYAGLAAASLLFLGLHAALMYTVFHITDLKGRTPPVTPFGPLTQVLAFFYVVIGAFIVCKAVGNFLSARFLRGRRHRTFSLIVAGINCLGIPLGTILGVFTLIVLLRPSVRTLYRIEGG